MRFINRYTVTAILAALLMACEEFDPKGFFAPPSEPVNKRFVQSMQLNEQHPDDSLITTSHTEYTVYLASDFHIDKTADCMAQFLRAASTDNSALLALMLGDITDAKGGHPIAHDTIKSNLRNGLALRSVTGNHDLYFNQWESYKHYWGSSTYYFIIETADTADLFICLDSGSGTLGKKQLGWLKGQLASLRALYRHCFIVTHTNFWDVDLGQIPSGSFSIEETAMLQGLFAKYDVTAVLNGHDHHHEIQKFNGTMYVTIGETIDGSSTSGYVVMTVTDAGIEIERKIATSCKS